MKKLSISLNVLSWTLFVVSSISSSHATTFDEVMNHRIAEQTKAQSGISTNEKVAELQDPNPKQSYEQSIGELNALDKKNIDWNEYGLAFFFSESCPFCHQFSPVIREWAGRHRVKVRAITLTGGGLPEYPQPEQANNREILHFFGAGDDIRYPSVFMYKLGDFYGGSVRITNGYVDYTTFTNLWNMAHQPEYLRAFAQ